MADAPSRALVLDSSARDSNVHVANGLTTPIQTCGTDGGAKAQGIYERKTPLGFGYCVFVADVFGVSELGWKIWDLEEFRHVSGIFLRSLLGVI